jgi:hypothetical protein
MNLAEYFMSVAQCSTVHARFAIPQVEIIKPVNKVLHVTRQLLLLLLTAVVSSVSCVSRTNIQMTLGQWAS